VFFGFEKIEIGLADFSGGHAHFEGKRAAKVGKTSFCRSLDEFGTIPFCKFLFDKFNYFQFLRLSSIVRMTMKNSLFFVSVAILIALSSCSTQNKVAFGDRKFHPDPHKPASVVSSKVQNPSAQQVEVSIGSETILSDDLVRNQINSEENARSTETNEHPAKSRLSKWQKMRQAIAMATILRESSMGKLAQQHSLTETNDEKKTSSGATIGFIAGILSIFIAGIPLGLLAVILCSIALSKSSAEYRKGLATVGLILGLIGIVGAVVFLASM